jgi:hypothetical protein
MKQYSLLIIVICDDTKLGADCASEYNLALNYHLVHYARLGIKREPGVYYTSTK